MFGAPYSIAFAAGTLRAKEMIAAELQVRVMCVHPFSVSLEHRAQPLPQRVGLSCNAGLIGRAAHALANAFKASDSASPHHIVAKAERIHHGLKRGRHDAVRVTLRLALQFACAVLPLVLSVGGRVHLLR
eukprot:scaffold237812_cov25-Tisochrysis_lutea.AAC.3